MNSPLQLIFKSDRSQARQSLQDLIAGDFRPLLMHVHIPKCAGTSFNHLLSESFGSRYLPLYSTSPGGCFSVQELNEQVKMTPDVAAISSHSFRLYPRRIGNRVPLYVTFLRDPLEWMLSNMTYLIQNYHQLSDAHRSTLPAQCAEMSVRELLLWFQERNEREQRPQLDVLHYFTAPTADAQSFTLSQSDLLDLGKHLLDQCFFVGLVEQMPQCLNRLRDKLKSIGLSLSTQDLPTLNTSRQSRGDLSWLTKSDPVGRHLLGRLARDQALYQHAVEHLQG